ncbi:uncharacterized protein METZ01_LOCUS494825 [marine metagenome]|uniref:Uncharacterized protein n=1 Tax=marine metagenome TaxID=408172 RepID=A0A383DC73_9ZZZZ
MAVSLLPSSISGMSIVDWLAAGMAAVVGFTIANNFSDDLYDLVARKE